MKKVLTLISISVPLVSAFVGFGIWLGSVDTHLNTNTEDIKEIRESIDTNTEDIKEIRESVDTNTDIKEIRESINNNTNDFKSTMVILQEYFDYAISANNSEIRKIVEDELQYRSNFGFGIREPSNSGQIVAADNDSYDSSGMFAGNTVITHDSDFEIELRKSLEGTLNTIPSNHLVAQEYETVIIKSASSTFHSVELQPNSKLVLHSSILMWSLTTLSLKIGEGAQILGMGDRGKDGFDGQPNRSVLSNCREGSEGVNGGNGNTGANGTDIEIKTIRLTVADTLLVDISGGLGGNGGKGGQGGKGGKGDRSKNCLGGDGGKGGKGGKGGDGGKGGNLSIYYAMALSKNSKILDVKRVSNSIKHNRSGGVAGFPGTGGTGGYGGLSLGKNILGHSIPDGKSGDFGNSGDRGEFGSSGSTVIVRQ